MATTCKLISKNVLGSSAASVTLSSIPGTYTDLLICYTARTDTSGVNAEAVKARFNGAASDTSHSDRYLYAGDASPASGTDSYARAGYATAVGSTSDTFASNEIYIPNYAGSTNKSYSGTYVTENNSSASGAAYIMVNAGLWSSTDAITAIELIPAAGGSFISGSSFFLYGITKA